MNFIRDLLATMLAIVFAGIALPAFFILVGLAAIYDAFVFAMLVLIGFVAPTKR